MSKHRISIRKFLSESNPFTFALISILIICIVLIILAANYRIGVSTRIDTIGLVLKLSATVIMLVSDFVFIPLWNKYRRSHNLETKEVSIIVLSILAVIIFAITSLVHYLIMILV